MFKAALSNKCKNPNVGGGIHPPQMKNTAEMETAIMPTPPKVNIAMSQHLGRFCEPTVKVGDEVFIGTLVGDSQEFLSAPIYSSVSGKVTALKTMLLPRKSLVEVLEITSDGRDMLDPDIKPPVVENREDFIAAVKKSGLVGLGGAGFPTWIKLSPPKGKEIDTLIINAVECEPYITSDYRQVLESPDDVIEGTAQVIKYLNIPQTYIAIKDDKVKALAKLEEALAKQPEEIKSRIEIMPFRSVYPLGAEKVLINLITGKEINIRQIPADVGCLVLNVTSASFIAQYLKTGIPLVKRRVTVEGTAIANPQNVLAPIGASIKDIIDFTGGFKVPAGKIISGGLMTGATIDRQQVPLLKSDNAILALCVNNSNHPAEMNCIRCGRCIEACPLRLMPTYLEDMLKADNIAGLNRGGVINCMECGSCSYVCPSHRQLLQTMKLAKDRVRYYQQKEGSK